MGIPSKIAMCLAEIALVARSGGHLAQAVEMARQAVAITRDTGEQTMRVLSLNYLGAALIGVGDTVAARQALSEASQRALAAQYPWFLMTSFYYFAELLVLESSAINLPFALERKSLAVALLSCVRIHPATWQIYRDKAAQLQTEIEGTLSAEILTTAIGRAQSYTLEEIVSTLLRGEPDALVKDSADAV